MSKRDITVIVEGGRDGFFIAKKVDARLSRLEEVHRNNRIERDSKLYKEFYGKS